jgi:hypothetical protein
MTKLIEIQEESKSWRRRIAQYFLNGSMNLIPKPWLSSGNEFGKSERVKRL